MRYKTEEERLQVKRANDKRWRANRTQEQKDRKNSSARKYSKNRSEAQVKETCNRQSLWYKEKYGGVFVVYKHINNEGEVYYGSGNLRRPYENHKANRSKAHYKAFRGIPNVEIIATFQYKHLATLLEHCLVNLSDINSLVNQVKPLNIGTYVYDKNNRALI